MIMAFCPQNCTDIQKEKKSSRDPEKKIKFEAEGREFEIECFLNFFLEVSQI